WAHVRPVPGGVIGRVDDMVIVRGVNVYPSAVENLVRQFAMVDEFRVQVSKTTELAELSLQIELVDGADAASACGAIQQHFRNTLGLRPEVIAVPRGTLPRFELKAKRFYLVSD